MIRTVNKFDSRLIRDQAADVDPIEDPAELLHAVVFFEGQFFQPQALAQCTQNLDTTGAPGIEVPGQDHGPIVIGEYRLDLGELTRKVTDPESEVERVHVNDGQRVLAIGQVKLRDADGFRRT